MYKKQMTAQKVICLLSIIASVMCFVYSLGLMTDLYDGLYPVRDERKITMGQRMLYRGMAKEDYPAHGFELYDEMQPFNRELLVVSIGLILLSVLLFVTNTATRRKYYIANYVAVGLNVVANIATAIWAHGYIVAYRAAYLTVDQELLAYLLKQLSKPFVFSTFWFDAHYFVFALSLLASVLLVLNVIWKLSLMKQEKQLLEEGKAVSA